MRVRLLTAGGVLLAAATLLSACTGASTASDGASEASVGPLDSYLAQAQGTDLDDAQFAAQNDLIEEVVAECMKAAGFEYAPVPYAVGRPGEWRVDDEDWVAQWGYGATDWPGKADVELSGPEGDVNAAYVATLGESEAAAYAEVLWGPALTEDEIAERAASGEQTWQQQGCWGSATHEVRGDDPTVAPAHAQLMTAIEAFRSSLEDDPGLAALDADWAACMAAAGRGEFPRQGDAEASVYQALDDYYLSLEEWVPSSPELDAVKRAEIDLALADLDCRESTDYRSRERVVRDEQEQRFVDDHRAELEALVADAE